MFSPTSLNHETTPNTKTYRGRLILKERIHFTKEEKCTKHQFAKGGIGYLVTMGNGMEEWSRCQGPSSLFW